MTTETRTPTWTLGDRLRKSREAAGMRRQQDMADLLHVARATIAGWENDKHSPDYVTLLFWADRTGVDLEWLMGDDASTKCSSTLTLGAPEDMYVGWLKAS